MILGRSVPWGTYGSEGVLWGTYGSGGVTWGASGVGGVTGGTLGSGGGTPPEVVSLGVPSGFETRVVWVYLLSRVLPGCSGRGLHW